VASNNRALQIGLLLLVACTLLGFTMGVVIGMRATVDSKQVEIAELQEQLTKCGQEHDLCIWQTEGILSENQELWKLNAVCREAVVLCERYVVELEDVSYGCLWLLEQLTK